MRHRIRVENKLKNILTTGGGGGIYKGNQRCFAVCQIKIVPDQNLALVFTRRRMQRCGLCTCVLDGHLPILLNRAVSNRLLKGNVYEKPSCTMAECFSYGTLVLVLLTMSCAASFAQSATASFGNVAANGGTVSTSACFDGLAGYYPMETSANISTNVGNAIVMPENTDSGYNCAQVSFTPSGNPGAISGSTTVPFIMEGDGSTANVTYSITGNVIVNTVTGYINPKYVVVGVTYAPPGPSPNTFVNYMNSTFVGTTTSFLSSFKSSNTLSISLSYSTGIPGVFGGKITATNSNTNSQTTTNSSSVTTSIQVDSGEQTYGTGDYFAPVDNDYDLTLLSKINC
ncbi:MAG: hypothetical protein ACP5EP_07180 [Acidobacteriaceae bacterium]